MSSPLFVRIVNGRAKSVYSLPPKQICDIVTHEAHTFRPGAPITTWDIRIAAAADGYDLSGVSGSDIASALSLTCSSSEYRNPHNKRSWTWTPETAEVSV